MNFFLFWTLKLGFLITAAQHIPDRGSWSCCLTLAWLHHVSSPSCAQPLIPTFHHSCCHGNQLLTASSDSTLPAQFHPSPHLGSGHLEPAQPRRHANNLEKCKVINPAVHDPAIAQ